MGTSQQVTEWQDWGDDDWVSTGPNPAPILLAVTAIALAIATIVLLLG